MNKLSITNDFLPEKDYFPEETKKTQIVLHHTVSSGTAKSVRDYFEQKAGRVGVPFIIDKFGNILCLFNPKHWAYHLGLTTADNLACNKKSIGIELVNEGILSRESVGKDVVYQWTFGKFFGKVKQLPELWRGSYFFADYRVEQIIAVAELCKKLCADFGIPKNVLGTFDYSKDYHNYNGIIGHCNVRSDKSDISPAFNYELFKEVLNA